MTATTKIVPRQIQLPDHLEAIRTYYADRTGLKVLSDADERIRMRLLQCWTLRCQGFATTEVINMMVEEHQITERTAYRDLKDAVALFGDVEKAEKEGERQILYTITQRLLKKAEEAEDYDGAAKLVAQLIKLKRFDQLDAELPDWSRMQPGLVTQVLDEITRRYLAQLHGADAHTPGVIDFNKIEITDAEWEEAADSAD